ncbi:hypothetical protein [Sphingorhabdus sp. 109]|uniref:hypothetical protein n=1 Tax=Sphingorhabdus sp. 109 TaxID=2653173 RepID=UPI0012F468DF|nr:hypothetical protein [Sphingorhabdus sp. 109]VWX56686.1 hypothetical protein SPHINGOR109_10540 [Sphingorhabdus sp. 109]
MIKPATITRREYEKRLALAEALLKTADFTYVIAERLHNWQRIAWLLDPAGRSSDEHLLIFPEDLQAMADEAAHCRDIWLGKHRADPADSAINARARALCHITRALEIRLNSARRYARPIELEKAA